MYTDIMYPCVQVQSVTNILDCTWIVVQESSTICGSKTPKKVKPHLCNQACWFQPSLLLPCLDSSFSPSPAANVPFRGSLALAANAIPMFVD